MTRIAPNTLAHNGVRAIRLISTELDDNTAIQIVSDFIDILEDPDDEMLEAGMAELELQLPPGNTKRYRRELTRSVWRAMLARVPR